MRERTQSTSSSWPGLSRPSTTSLGGLDIDRGDFRMPMRRAQHMQPQRAVVGLIVDERPLADEKPLVLQPLDGLAGPEAQIAGKNVHPWSLELLVRSGVVLADVRRRGQPRG